MDTLVKVAHIKDMNDYSQVMMGLDPFLHMARESGSHLLLVHHAGKSDRDGGDNLLGSTAIFGTVDTCLIQKRSDKYRTIQSINRYGTDLEESVLEWDEAAKAISLGGSKKEEEVARLSDEILTFLKTQESPVGREVLEESIEGRTGLKRQALKGLVESGRVARGGQGRNKDPFTYHVSEPCSLVPPILWEQGNKVVKNDQTPHEHRPEPCSQVSLCFEGSGDPREQGQEMILAEHSGVFEEVVDAD